MNLLLTPSKLVLSRTGTKTALSSALLAWLFKEESPDSALVTSANFLGSDTDTIATMAGAILGAVAHAEPQFDIQDRSYIREEARRLFRIATKQSASSFEYFEVMNWRPPRASVNAVVEYKNKVVLSGLGQAEVMSDIWQARKHDGIGGNGSNCISVRQCSPKERLHYLRENTPIKEMQK